MTICWTLPPYPPAVTPATFLPEVGDVFEVDDNLALHKKIKFKKDKKSVEAKLSTLQTALGRVITDALEALESQRAGSA